ncbi:hypothetical protein D0T53_11615 [Dysgonomonas sp. 216]|uniref:hypothetical protein n=1 Tax=Dysgonomonas sp. 216 TaxID=2302934 RepID=UPI0013D1B0FA|nr:hypothetical protein [Dysgonomonas sp. 216]NDW19553.1 hypothetical protein [Dysgonomonas sp. 216]
MNDKRNLFNLIDIVSAQTNTDPKIVRLFITQLFREIEKELVESSYVQINGLGIFRIIKSSTSEKILFLGKFRKDIELAKEKERIDPDKYALIPLDDKEEVKEPEAEIPGIEINIDEQISPPSDFNTSDSESVLFIPIENENNETTDPIAEVEEKYTQDVTTSSEETQTFVANDNNDDEYYIDDPTEEKTNWKRNFLLVLSTIICAVALLYLLYPSEPIVIDEKLPYTEITNPDTINILKVIKIEDNTNFLFLSKYNYGHEIFWSYIYNANENGEVIPLDIKKGTIIKIPKIEDSLLDFNNEENVERIKSLNELIFAKIRSFSKEKR